MRQSFNATPECGRERGSTACLHPRQVASTDCFPPLESVHDLAPQDVAAPSASVPSGWRQTRKTDCKAANRTNYMNPFDCEDITDCVLTDGPTDDPMPGFFARAIWGGAGSVGA
jgi:hypothetical protein